jgi:Xaa-Pro aminopeptidase
MKTNIILLFTFLSFALNAQETPTDFLSSDFHKGRRDAFRAEMPANSVAVLFANPVRNRANDVDYIYHQDPDFQYLTGYNEPHAVLLLFSDLQTDKTGTPYNEIIYVQKRDARAEQWNGRRLGVEGVIATLGFEIAYNGIDFISLQLDFKNFNKVLFYNFKNDYRDGNDGADLFNLVAAFKEKVGYPVNFIPTKQSESLDMTNNLDLKSLGVIMSELRETKLPEEMELLKKAIEISAVGQLEVMKAMHPGMSETEVQGIHEYVYKKYGAEYEGYPSIVGGGNNGCILHYIENNKPELGNDLVLMDLGAEYHGYTADVTRTIPANGVFSPAQKAIYEIVYKAQEAGIAASVVGAPFNTPGLVAAQVVAQGLLDLGIIKEAAEAKRYFPHGTSHYLGLDVHDKGTYGPFKANTVITVEPGIYIPKGSDCDSKWWGIAVRIEDDILISENGPVLLSFMAPRSVADIEAAMKLASPLNSFSLPSLN